MATYFHGGNSELQTDGLHTLYLMSPNYISAYNSASSDTSQQQTPAPHQSMILLNSALPHALAPSQISHAPPPAQSQFLTLPFAQPISADDPSRSGNGFHYNLWSGGGGGGQVEVSGVATGGGSHPYQIQLDSGGGGGSSDVFRRPAALSPTTNNQQGLALSLSSQHQPGGGGNSNLYSSRVGGGGGGGSSSDVLGGGGEESNGVQNFIMGSKYLKAAQDLLDEVVNVGKAAAAATALTDQPVKKELGKFDNNNTNGDGAAASNNDAAGGGLSRPAAAEQLSVTQRQELQMKKTKLISMLDEVEQRYRQYHHQMKIVVSSFEQVAGFGSAKSYTSLALKTISKQFRCLKDAITSQIKEASRSLGEEAAEENCLGVKGEGSRLRMIDHQLRQQRALQQLGMMQHNAWRPQRGLPERAVSVLRAWLFEHFLHPYPKDSDKHMLAKQTGLTRSQVSNWFINARVRLWKPMVEEMYLEEVKDHPEQKAGCAIKDANNNGASTSKSADPSYKQQSSISNKNGMQLQEVKVTARNQNASPADISNSTMSTTSPNASSFQAPPGFGLVGASADMEGLLHYGKGQKKARGGAHETQDNSPSSILSMDMEMKAVGEMGFGRQDVTAGNKFGAGYGGGGGGGFGAYHQLGEVGRFNTDPHHQMNQAQAYHHANNGSVVSLTLGLPPGENLNYFSQSMHGFERRLEMGGNGVEHGDDFCGINGSGSGNSLHLQAASPHSNMGFQNMDMQNRKRYAAQLLPDFVA